MLTSRIPSIRWRTVINALRHAPQSAEARRFAAEVKDLPIARALLQHVDEDGVLWREQNVYDRWQGSHWVPPALADIAYPTDHPRVRPMAIRVASYWLTNRFYSELVAESKKDAYKRRDSIPVMNVRHRTCASQQGSALCGMLKLGVEDNRIH